MTGPLKRSICAIALCGAAVLASGSSAASGDPAIGAREFAAARAMYAHYIRVAQDTGKKAATGECSDKNNYRCDGDSHCETPPDSKEPKGQCCPNGTTYDSEGWCR